MGKIILFHGTPDKVVVPVYGRYADRMTKMTGRIDEAQRSGGFQTI